MFFSNLRFVPERKPHNALLTRWDIGTGCRRQSRADKNAPRMDHGARSRRRLYDLRLRAARASVRQDEIKEERKNLEQERAENLKMLEEMRALKAQLDAMKSQATAPTAPVQTEQTSASEPKQAE